MVLIVDDVIVEVELVVAVAVVTGHKGHRNESPKKSVARK